MGTKMPETIIYGMHETPLGEIVLAKTDVGLCWLGFMTEGYKGDGFSRMQSFFPGADFVRDDEAIDPLAEEVLSAWQEDRLADVKLDLRGTPFQLSVWEKLLQIPKGQVLTYGDVANDIGNPKAMRAVGTAVGSNPVSLIVPCHRVVPSAGGVGNYGWGAALKKQLLSEEAQ